MQGRKILLGISGSISAYKTLELIRLIVKAGGEVRAVMTRAACELLSPLSVEVLSEHRVYVEEFALGRDGIDHIELHRWADLLAVCPASANTIAKAAHGIADDLLSGTVLTIGPGRTAIFPAMNTNMWLNPATQANVETLRARGCYVAPTASGSMATRSEGEGPGRLLEPAQLFEHLTLLLESRDSALKGKRVLISAGGTREAIDDVRFVGNRSSGKMGHELARAFSLLGAGVSLVTASGMPVGGIDVGVTRVESASEMRESLLKEFPACDLLVMCAAVSDYHPAKRHEGKLHREDTGALTIELKPGADILSELSSMKKPGQVLVGFAAEVSDHEARAKEKLKSKDLDIIVMNDVSQKGVGFEGDLNGALMLGRGGDSREFPVMSKRDLAWEICRAIERTIKE